MPEQFIGNDELFKDPEFLKLSPEAKMKVLEKVDADFSKLTPSGKSVVLQELTNMSMPQMPKPGETPVGSTPSQIAAGLGMGAAKSVGRMGMTTAQWLQYVLGRNVSPTPMSLLPKTPLEETGGTIGQIGVPVAIGMMTGGASIPVQAAIGGLTGGIAAASEGASPTSTQVAAGLGAAAPAVSAGVQQFIQPMLRRKASELVADAIGPSGQKEKEALSKVIDDITRKRPIAFSSEGLLKKFTKAADKANRQFDAILDAGPQEMTVSEIRSLAREISSVADDYRRGVGNALVTPEARQTADELKKVAAEVRKLGFLPGPWQKLGGGGNLPQRVIPGTRVNTPMSELRKLKQDYDRIVTGVNEKNIARTVAEGTRADAAQEGFFKIRGAMVKKIPGLEKAGRASQVAITPRNIMARQEISNIKGGLGRVGDVVELGMLASGVATGRLEPVVAAASLAALRHILASTPRKLISAAARTTLANAIERGDAVKALQAAAQTPAIVEQWNQLQTGVVRAQESAR